ncbi:hypothetical protein LTR29_002424 [Friedmanniomyces endolithicus]|nr:hypothetical protein LTR29_002424 [Friedmanniomyces endolithicus]
MLEIQAVRLARAEIRSSTIGYRASTADYGPVCDTIAVLEAHHGVEGVPGQPPSLALTRANLLARPHGQPQATFTVLPLLFPLCDRLLLRSTISLFPYNSKPNPQTLSFATFAIYSHTSLFHANYCITRTKKAVSSVSAATYPVRTDHQRQPMTCVSTSAWQSFGNPSPWSPMNPDATATTSDLERQLSHGYASSESESIRPGGSSGKKRASRAGTRSVTSLSAAQLERKRANDREAQRAIRQRNKDHIDSLEKTINDLRGSQESSDKAVAVTRQRNQELTDEIVYLRSRLNDGGYASDAPSSEMGHPRSDSGMMSGHSPSLAALSPVSGSSIQRPSSISRSLSVTTAPTSSRHGSLQQGSFLPTAPSSAVTISDQSSMAGTLPLTTWRSHDGTSSLHPVQTPPSQAPGPLLPHHPPAYHMVPQQERPAWAGAPQHYQYAVNPDSQRAHLYETQQASPGPISANPHHYAQPLGQPYAPAPALSPAPQQHTQSLPQMTQAGYQHDTVSGPAYHVQHQNAYQHAPPQPAYPPPQQQPQLYQQPSQVQVGPMQGGPPNAVDYASPHGSMQPPPVPTSQYQPPPAEQTHYAPQPMQSPLQYRDEATGRSYTMAHYPAG